MSDELSPKVLMEALAKLIIANPCDALALIANQNDPRSIPDRLKALPPEMKFAIAGIKFTRDGPQIQMHSKTAAIELAGRALALWADKTILEDARRPEPEPLPEGASLQNAWEYYQSQIEPRRH